MNKEVLDFQVNNICEAYGCFKKATTKISVKVGQLGSISLDLCNNCTKKFDQKGRMLESVHQPVSNTNQSTQSSSVQGVLHQEND
jgi:hypothetical protein